MAQPAEQGELLPKPDGSDATLEHLNLAKGLAWDRAAYAVEFLSQVMRDEDNDLDQRLHAAGDLLNFAVKGPY